MSEILSQTRPAQRSPQTAAPSTFISFTGQDSPVATRFYNDLTRSGYDVWSYEFDSVYGVDFREDFRGELLNRDYFCLLDIPNSRSSHYVREECNLAIERQRNDPSFQIIPCVIADSESSWFKSNLLLPQQLMLQYVRLFPYNEPQMVRLCFQMGNRKLLPFSDLPEDLAFQDELFRSKIPTEAHNEILTFYGNFRRKDLDTQDTYAWIRTVISRLKREGVELATAWVAW